MVIVEEKVVISEIKEEVIENEDPVKGIEEKGASTGDSGRDGVAKCKKRSLFDSDFIVNKNVKISKISLFKN